MVKMINGSKYELVEKKDDFILLKNNERTHGGGNPLYGQNTRLKNSLFVEKYKKAINENNETILNDRFLSAFD